MSSPTDVWNALLSDEDAAAMCARLSAQMRERRLRFGDRVICPFLRPFFLDTADETRVRGVAEMLWTLGERVAREAITRPELLRDLALSDDEIRLAQIDPGYETASTAARADAFILPGSLQFAEYNGESPAGAGYSQLLADVFDQEPMMARFRERFDARSPRPVEALLDALVASYREWGGTASPPRIAIVDWREVPTFSEFEILRDAFIALGVPTVICDPRDLEFAAGSRFSAGTGRGLYVKGEPIDLVYRRVLINDIVARPAECRALLDGYRSRTVCVANTLRCKIPHKKAFFAVLTDERHAGLFSAEERAMIQRHVPWTALVEERRVAVDGQTVDLVPHLRAHREQFVIKPNDEYGGTGVTLGWETSESDWDAAIARAIAERDPGRGWVAQQRIAVRREVFPVCTASAEAPEQRDMLVDFAPYIFRGKLAGYLTRLSASGLANVTSGGGQVPAFVVQIEMMNVSVFGFPSADLAPGAHNAVEVCLGIKPGEKVALIADRASAAVAASIAAVLDEVGAPYDAVLIEDVATRPMTNAPAAVLDALERADAGILCVQPEQGELGARMAIVSVVERRAIRYAHMVGVTPQIMQQGMRADYRLVDELSQRLCERMPRASRLRVETAAGTNLSATFDPALHWVKTSGLINRRYWSNLPAGEVFTTPLSVDGVFVCDGTAGDYFGPKYGDLRKSPLTLEIAGGRLQSAHSDRKDLEQEFWDYCHTDEYSDRVGELAFGTNIALEDMIGVLLQDEKIPGVHLAFGDPYGSQTGAPWKSRTHIDVLTRGCDVWIDDEQVIGNGRYLMDRFGL